MVSQKSCDFTVRALEDIGVSACIIEDKCGLKQNSLFDTPRQQNLEDIPSSFLEVKAATEARRDKKFMVITRIEALISGAGETEAICRAKAYIEAGADAIMIHSSQKTFDEIRSFMDTLTNWTNTAPWLRFRRRTTTLTFKHSSNGGHRICLCSSSVCLECHPEFEFMEMLAVAYIQNDDCCSW